ncbi:MAG: hypothetical protein JNL60_13460 [Bacteroidia bacterium]|nr:hypothetical protein [Bacteroidia bacterium]
MRTFLYLSFISFCLFSCNNSSDKELSPAEKHVRDSISKAHQRMSADSAKKKNPFLIMPPDSEYTGSYTDKYPNGIIKFKGQFRFGQKHGHWLSFYPNGLKWSEMHYDKGLRHGPNITYFEDGVMRYSGFYKLDKKDSVWCYYDSIGRVVEKVLFKDNRYVSKLPLN